jgi:hypothetical protein
MLFPPQVDLINLWLAAAAQHRRRASASFWTPLAMLAARTTHLDAAALARAVGERGIWFIAQNPQWARLSARIPSRLPDEPVPANDVTAEVGENALRADPELIMRAATPWSTQLSRTVLQIIASGQLRERNARYAAAVGARMPLEHYELLRSAVAEITAQDQPPTPVGLRSVYQAFQALERVAWVRLEIDSAFTSQPIAVERLEIPPW